MIPRLVSDFMRTFPEELLLGAVVAVFSILFVAWKMEKWRR